MASQEITESAETWTKIIRPKRGIFDLRLNKLWHARDLVVLFVWRDFVSVYKQTILGPLWYIIQPLLTTVVFTIIFGNFAGLPSDGIPSFLFYMSGTVVWSYFAACLTKTSDVFINNFMIFSKVYFPRLVTPVSILISNLISFGIQFLFFLGFYAYYLFTGAAIKPNLWILMFPVLILIMAGLGLGVGIIISSLTVKYRDLRYLVTFGVQLLMYATPVILPISAIPPRFQWVMLANPMTPIIEIFRYGFLGAGEVNLGNLLYSFGFTAVVLFIGVLIFNRVETTFMDTV
jgi:lipopolysaccharide transport system permease protein